MDIFISISVKIISFFSDLFSLIAAAIAIYLFIFKRESIKSIFKILLSYSYQITLSELKAKLERLNDLSVDETSQIDDIINILNEIVGQIRGNSMLQKKCAEILKKISFIAENPKKLTEPKKRSLVSELRENLRNIEVESYDELMGR